MHGNTQQEIESIKKERILQEIKRIQHSNKEVLQKESNWIHEDIKELEKLDSLALDSWLYGAKIISKINQKKIKLRSEYYKEEGIFHQIYRSKRDKKELDPGENEKEN